MTTILCTLYNSLYLDKGLVLYDSLCECAKDFKLYVLCMDEKCYEVLTDLKQEHHIPVRLEDFEAGDEELLRAKANRPMGEYCWTCSSSFIRYVLKHYGEGSCTYIDSDMFFYNDPQVLIDEMLSARKDVMVVPHWFHEDNKIIAEKVGEYCVEFNTFMNNSKGLEVLDYWRNRCLESCSNIGDGIHWGDQKYLEEFVAKFDCVYVCQNRGSGVAYWNLTTFKMDNNTKKLIYKENGRQYDTIFYHFQGFLNINRDYFVLGGIKTHNGFDNKLVKFFYEDYLCRIQKCRIMLNNKYGINIMIIGHPASKHLFTGFKQTIIGGFLNFLFLSIFKNAKVMHVRYK